MTNGEKMRAVFPNIKMWGESKDTLDYSLGGMIHRIMKNWWNAEYKEPSNSGTPNSWIPVSETLPEDRRPVLVTAYWHETYQTMMASYFGGGVWWCVPFNNTGKHEQKLKPKAWMPLPDPYTAESETAE